MKYCIPLLLLLLIGTGLFSQTDSTKRIDPWKFTRNGNQFYTQNNFASAETQYRLAVDKDSLKNVASYNLGNALYKQGKYDEASHAYSDAITGNNPDSLARTWHNLGNAMLKQGKYQESINAYKQALRLHPNDEDTRYNLAYAQSKLKSQQPPPPPSENKNKNKKDSTPKQPDQPKQNKDKDKDQHQPKQKPDPQMSQDEAQRMLDAMKDAERNTRNNINKNNKQKNAGRHSKDKDW